jgi:hypothetical protein
MNIDLKLNLLQNNIINNIDESITRIKNNILTIEEYKLEEEYLEENMTKIIPIVTKKYYNRIVKYIDILYNELNINKKKCIMYLNNLFNRKIINEKKYNSIIYK